MQWLLRVFFVYSDANSAPLIRIKGLLNLSSRGTMRQTGVPDYLPTAFRQTMKNRFLAPVTRVFSKRFFDHIFDYRQAWSTRKQWK